MKVTKENYMTLLPSLKIACSKLKSSSRRLFLAQLVKDLGYGGYRLVERTMSVGRKTIQKGMQELETGILIEDQFGKRGNKLLEETNPKLIKTIQAILDASSQIDPKFTSERLYTRLSVVQVRKELHKKGYKDKDLPCNQTIRNKMISLGYKRRKVAKTKPAKKN